MSEFEPAFEFMIPHEGGYVSDPADPGGETKYGISKKSYPNEDIKNLTLEDAKRIYRRDFWLPAYEQINSQAIANKVFDLAVNMGKHYAHIIVQRAINYCGCDIAEDGIIGRETVARANMLPESNLLSAIKYLAAEKYKHIAENNPQEEKFLAGWLKRANA